MILTILGTLGVTVYVVWCWSTPFCRWFRRAAVVCQELRPFVPAGLTINYVDEISRHPFSAARVFWLLLGLGVWWFVRLDHKDHDDDRWKRRKKKLASKVAQVGGKLAVVPAEVSAR